MDKPTIKDKAVQAYVESLEAELEKYKRSPYLKTYITLSNQLDNFNDQLKIRKDKIIVDGNPVEVEAGVVDLFADGKDKSFDRVKWYFDNMLSLNKQLDDLRKLMTPEDNKKLQEAEKLGKLGLAEKLAMKDGAI